MYNEYRPANTDNLKIKHHYLTIMDSRNIPREIFHISLGATSCVPQEDGPSGYVEYFTRDVSLVHYRAILHSAAPRVILPINNCKLSLDATRLVTIYSCLSMVMVFYFEVVCICRSIFYKNKFSQAVYDARQSFH